MNSTLVFAVALLDATACASAQERVSSEKYTASKRRESVTKAMVALEGGMVDDIQLE